jgi:hypothetical protein
MNDVTKETAANEGQLIQNSEYIKTSNAVSYAEMQDVDSEQESETTKVWKHHRSFLDYFFDLRNRTPPPTHTHTHRRKIINPSADKGRYRNAQNSITSLFESLPSQASFQLGHVSPKY